MLKHKLDFVGPLQWVKFTRRLSITLDDKLSWAKHLTDLQKTYASKLALLSRTNSCHKTLSRDFTQKSCYRSMLYGQILWKSGGKTHLINIERLRESYAASLGTLKRPKH